MSLRQAKLPNQEENLLIIASDERTSWGNCARQLACESLTSGNFNSVQVRLAARDKEYHTTFDPLDARSAGRLHLDRLTDGWEETARTCTGTVVILLDPKPLLNHLVAILHHNANRRIVFLTQADLGYSSALKQVHEILEESCVNYLLLVVNNLIEGPTTGKRIVCVMDGKSQQSSFTEGYTTEGDLVEAAFLACKHPSFSPSELERHCSLPRTVLLCKSYGDTGWSKSTSFHPMTRRQKEKYAPPLLATPQSRWGTLKYSRNMPAGTFYLRQTQKQPLQTSGETGNILPHKLKQINRSLNH